MPSGFFLSYYKQVSFQDLFSVMFFFFFFFLLFIGDFIFEMAPKHCVKVLSSVPKHKKAMMPLTENTDVLAKLHLGKNCSPVGREFNVNQSTIYIKEGVFK